MTDIKNEKFNELKMLIVDDSNALGMIIKDILVTLGFNLKNIEQVGDAYDALNTLGSQKFDLMSSNLWMPSSLNGLELLEKIRSHKNEDIKDIPFILITGETNDKFISQALEKGANCYLSKPFNIEKFKDELEKIFVS
jgi:two-component system, chemotaxis family, chemotaxis protein CheY